MSRREFSAKIKLSVIKRATRDNVVYCEKCGAQAKRFQIDHVRPDGLGGEPVIGNAMLICQPCFEVKNPADTSVIARAKRQEAVAAGVRAEAARPIESRGFVKKPKRAPRPVVIRTRDIFGRPI